jgi:tRNA (guanosine-2'-O-)-methyltransferase
LHQGLKEYFSNFITENKKNRIDEVLEKRTRYVTVVLEDIYKPHNASAVLRTVDCFGLQDVNVIENYHTYHVNPYVTRGASQWVDLLRFREKGENNTAHCFKALKEQGYKIFATSPNVEGVFPEHIDISQKIAIVLGNEHRGLTDYALQNADALVRLPMFGFTESYNISVTAAICLHDIVRKLYGSDIDWKLSEEEKEELRLKWYRKVVKRPDILEKEFLKHQGNR